MSRPYEYDNDRESRYQRRSSKLPFILVGMALFAILLIGYVLGIKNKFVSYENDILAMEKETQNVHASVFAQMKQQGVVVDKYGDMFQENVKAAIEGRYGEGGSSGFMQWFQEENPTVSPEIMHKLQVTIEAGYNKFESRQSDKLDIVRAYRTYIESSPQDYLAGFLGFPKKINLETADTIVTSAKTKEDFATGELSDPDIFGDE